jgi:uncharacterized RDD family membrane protein YckC
MPSTTPEVLSSGHIINPSNIYAGFWLRVAASLIDSVLLGFVGGILGTKENGLLALLIWLAYFSAMECSKYQGTLGKIALGLRVTDLNGTRLTPLNAVGRNLGKILSSLILGIGFLMAAFTAKKQALHDILAGTLVVKRK